eukprot:m.1296 g.1296  ORF g.1296 m.1296 type:complete len:342 (-) comp615_c0_seq1:175-1200(-)
MLCLSLWFVSVAIVVAIASVSTSGIIAPNCSLATVPIGYYGGIASRRGDANIAMLAKARMVIIEKWEGPCWRDCLAEPGSDACKPSCNVENYILDTMARIKKANPGTATLMYWNAELAFPFYTAVGKFKDAWALTNSSVTGKPIELQNDDAMNGIWVYGFDTSVGVQLYIDTVKNLTGTGLVDGFFGDTWGQGANPGVSEDDWVICNHNVCGNVTAIQGHRWNDGKATALAAVTSFVGIGPYYSEGHGGVFQGVGSNLNGHYIDWKLLKGGDPRDIIQDVSSHLKNHRYMYMSCTTDQGWQTNPNASATLASKCSEDTLARFLLGVQPCVFLGANGWDSDY